MKRSIFILLASMLPLFTYAQELHFGLKAGVQIGGIDGPKESIEESSFSTGFNIGISAAYDITSVMGIRAELQYAQINSENQIDGLSYLRMLDINNELNFIEGIRDQNLNIARSYLYLPVSIYGRFLERLEVYAGLQVGLLLSQTAAGELGFRRSGAPNEELRITLDYNYGSDGAGEFSDPERVILGNQFVHRQVGAYYEFEEVDDKLYNPLDLGVHLGLSFAISTGLYINAKGTYGLLDVTQNSVDRTYENLDNNNFVFAEDFDRNVFLELGVGFKF